MNFRRLILSLMFLSLGQMVFGQTVLAWTMADAKSITSINAKEPCAGEENEADCPDEERALSQDQSVENAIPIITSASDCKSNSCTGSECFIRGSCGSPAIHVCSKVLIPWIESLALYLEFLPQMVEGPDPSPPIRPPIS